MYGWLYIIRNGDLYKIGITKNIEQRMRQLKPDYIISKLYSSDFKQLEKEFHKRYKNVRIPQTEYFRLDQMQIREIKIRMSQLSYPKIIVFGIFIKSLCLIIVCFLFLFLLISLTINDMNNVLFRSLLWMEKILFVSSFISLFLESDKYLTLINEFKFRLTRSFIFIFCAFLFGFASRVLF